MSPKKLTTRSVPAWLAVSVAVVVGAGVFLVGQGDPDDVDQIALQIPHRPVLANLSEQEAAESRSHMDEAGQAGLDQIQDYMASDRIPVAYHGDVAGYITVQTYGLSEPTTKDDLGPVTDERGRLVGYWGSGIGFLPKHVVEAPDFNIEAAKRNAYVNEPASK